MTIAELVKRCYAQAKQLGWVVDDSPVAVPEQVALICSEACEALESYRNHEPVSWTTPEGKPMGIGSEYADVVIRVGHYAATLGIDLEAEIERKLQYNLTRGHRHGGKAC